jgi:hypothetical protein
MPVKFGEQADDLGSQVSVDDECARVGGVVKPEVRKCQLPEVSGRDGAAGMPSCMAYFFEKRRRKWFGFEDLLVFRVKRCGEQNAGEKKRATS